MSSDPKTPEASFKKHHKHKDPERSSKKRKRHEESQDTQPAESHSSKKHKSRPAEDGDTSHSKNKSKKDKSSRKESQQSTQSQTTPPPATPPSPFALQTTSLYVPLSPVTQSSPANGLCAEHLSPLILTYVPALQGILLSYSNARLSNTPPTHATATSAVQDASTLGKSISEYAFSYTWLTADFLVLKPVAGAEMEGYVNVENESRLGVLCWNLFNATIERKRLPSDWRWDGPTSRKRRAPPRDVDADEEEGEAQEDEEEQEAEGGFLDGNGEGVMGRHIKFKVVDWELDQSGKPAEASATNSSLVSFEGTMLSDEEEQKIRRQAMIKEADRLAEKRRLREKRLRAHAAHKRAAAEEAEDG